MLGSGSVVFPICALILLCMSSGAMGESEVGRIEGALSGEGTWESLNARAIKGRWVASLSAQGKEVRGTLSLTGSNVLSGAEVVGTVSDGRIVLGVVVDGATGATFAGRLDDGRVAGEWTFPALKDEGVWEGEMKTANTN